MVDLIVLNGPPASGKSTLAAAFVATRPLALNLDVDLVRGLLGRWTEQPTDAGKAARRLAVAMASTHLSRGFDVIVPQFLARAEFIIELEAVALDARARFVELALIVSRADALAAFARRSAAGTEREHREAAAMVEEAGGEPALGDMYDGYVALIESRPSVRRIDVAHGDVDATLRSIEAALAA